MKNKLKISILLSLSLFLSNIVNAGLISINNYDLTSISGPWAQGSTGWQFGGSGSVNLTLADTLLTDGYVDNFGHSVVNGIYSNGTTSLTFGTGGVDYLLNSFSFITSRNYSNSTQLVLDYRLDSGVWNTAVTDITGNILAPLSTCLASVSNNCAGKLATVSFGNVIADEWRLSLSGGQVSFHEVMVNGVLVPSADVPEPSTLAIFALGLMGLASRRLKQQS